MNSAASGGEGGFGGRIVLCIPHGGLNDTLCEIERCWDYCIKYERVLLVDTRNTGLMGEMGDFFRPRSQHGDVRFFSGEWSVDDLNRLSCIPSSLQGRIYKYQVMRSFEKNCRVDKETLTPLTFDFDVDYDESVLIHETNSGGNIGYRCLSRVYLVPEVRSAVVDALEICGSGYAAMHIRNTDYMSDYKGFVDDLRYELSGRSVLVCSDDMRVIEYSRRALTESHVFTVTSASSEDGKPIHILNPKTSPASQRYAAISSIVDLMALAHAEDLYCCKINRGWYSGYSRLAMKMKENREILDGMMQGGSQ